LEQKKALGRLTKGFYMQNINPDKIGSCIVVLPNGIKKAALHPP
jgi:hypothetical protein